MTSMDFRDLNVQEGEGWVGIQVRVQPRSSSNRIAGCVQGALKVHLTAPPVEGRANDALRAFLAALFHVARKDVEIVSGAGSRVKGVRLHGLAKEDLERSLGRRPRKGARG